MGVSQVNLNRAYEAAKAREADGYFAKVKAGDQRAASLFARLVAYDLNPYGRTSDYGWLTKQPGEAQVDGYAEDAIVFGVDQSDLQNVVDLIVGAGAPGASITAQVKERRPSNRWATPSELTEEEMAYLGGGQSVPEAPQYPSYEALGGDATGIAVTRQLEADYKRAGRPGLDADSGAWLNRVLYDYLTGKVPTIQASIDKHRPEWCAALGIPVL